MNDDDPVMVERRARARAAAMRLIDEDKARGEVQTVYLVIACKFTEGDNLAVASGLAFSSALEIVSTTDAIRELLEFSLNALDERGFGGGLH